MFDLWTGQHNNSKNFTIQITLFLKYAIRWFVFFVQKPIIIIVVRIELFEDIRHYGYIILTYKRFVTLHLFAP